MEIILHHDSFEQKRISALVISSLASTEILFHTVFFSSMLKCLHGCMDFVACLTITVEC